MQNIFIYFLEIYATETKHYPIYIVKRIALGIFTRAIQFGQGFLVIDVCMPPSPSSRLLLAMSFYKTVSYCTNQFQ